MKIKIADVIFDSNKRTLSNEKDSRKLEPKVFTLLTSLLHSPGEIITRDQLITRVWNNRVVGDGAINRTVSLLRNHFLALTAEPVIETVPTQGYRLIAHTETIEEKEQKQTNADRVNSTPHELTKLEKSYLWSLTPIRKIVLLTCTAIIVLLSWFFFPKAKPNPVLTATLISDPLIGLKGWEYGISATANGKQILFHHQDEGGNQQVFLYHSQTHQNQSIIRNARAAINSLGDSIVFAQVDNMNCYFGIFTTASSHIKRLFNCDEPPSKLIWKNKSVFYYNKRLSRSHPYQIFSYDTATSRLTQISNPKSNNNLRGDFDFASHPDSELLAILRYKSESETELVIHDANSLEEKHVINKRLVSVAWAPDNNSVILADASTLYQYWLDSTKLAVIKQLEISINSMAVVNYKQKHHVLLSNTDVTSNIIKYDIADKSHQVWQQSARAELLPRSQKNTNLVLSTRYKSHQFWQIDNTESSLIDVNLPFELKFTRYELSPDGKRILLTKQGACYEITLATKTVKQLFAADHQSYVSNYHATNTDDVVYSSNKSGQWQLWLYNRANKSHRQLTYNEGYSGRIKNNTLYFSKLSVDGLWSKDLTSRQEQLLIKDFSLLNWLNWQLIGDNIYFYRANSGIWRYSLDSQQETLMMTKPNNFVHQYTVTPNEDAILWVKRSSVEGDVYQYVLANSPVK